MSSHKSKRKIFLKNLFSANLTCGCGIKPKNPDVHQPKPISKFPIHHHDEPTTVSPTSTCENLAKIVDDQHQEVLLDAKEADKASSSTTLSLSIIDDHNNNNAVTTASSSTVTTTTTTTTTNDSSPELEIEPDTQTQTTPGSSSTSPAITDGRLSFRSPSKLGESIAVVKESNDPYLDFKHSMLQMIYEKEIFSSDDLKELLDCFLKLNSSCHHAIILRAFNELRNDVLGAAVEENYVQYSTKVKRVG